MQTPNEIFEVISDDGLEVVMFDEWVVITRSDGTHRRLVPRERFIYAAEHPFK